MKLKTVTQTEIQYSKKDLTAIRERARAIWQRKCNAMSTALDDWLEAERAMHKEGRIKHTRSDAYTEEEREAIRKRAQAIRDDKVRALRTQFDDWIEAEQELKAELEKNGKLTGLFEVWMSRAAHLMNESSHIEGEKETHYLHAVLEDDYIDMMAEMLR